jgi:hypothetical protein
MKTTEEFTAFYRSSLRPVIEGLEETRKKFIKTIRLACLGAAGALVLSIVVAAFSDKPEVEVAKDPYANQGGPSEVTRYNGGAVGNVLLLVIIGGVVGYHFWFKPKKKELKTRFKNEVMSKMVKFIDASLEFDPRSGISRSEYDQSKIFLTSGDRYMCEDLVSGKLGNTTIRFSEVHTQEEERDQDSKGSSWVTLFRGIIFVADFNKHFKGRTVVLTDQAEKTFGGLGTMFQKMNTMRDPLVKMENVDFEKAFAVYGSDPVEAHYILSPSLMKRILSIKAKAGKIELSFVDSHVFVAIPNRKNLFEANVFSSFTSYSTLESYNNTLQLIAGIVEDLNLNTRIWTKE